MSSDGNLGAVKEEEEKQETVSESQPLEVKICDPASTGSAPEVLDDVEINPAAAALIERQSEAGGQQGAITTFTIDACFQNTSQNPYRETTVTVPYLLRKVPSEDLVPPGWKNINRILVASYFSMFCCVLTGVMANHFAWEAKTDRSRGLYSLVQKQSRTAVRLIYISVGIGLFLVIIIPVAVVCGVYGC